ncbi:hypothetical protein GCM10011611_00280 [Aliidongia dinghuensis]|uniref:TfuA-like core domain-containing protein n=1 Tax=Aliidongia dinghuensis TaxID=1867774 RepID=A0A8J2YNL5_9PROT|nr:TfuA-like protein [Aliidongia dinghuensis]GGE98719.1 hypothetical protein GCM10011611_00280 [Aliidongia dinghuensis]
MTTLVFLGPTLHVADAARILPATYLPPAAQGDVYRAVRAHQPKVVALIDGQFLTSAAVWHRELLWAMDQGVRVYGAASMGALRAAELHVYGMAGVGRIFAAYRDGRFAPYDDPFEDDDEVAVIHGPAELGSQPLSDAMVDLRASLATATAEGVIEFEARDALVAAMKSLHFPERSFGRLIEAAAEVIGRSQAADLGEWLAVRPVSQKRQDAIALLERLAMPASPAPPIPFRFERALVWERFVLSAAALSAEERAVLKRLGEDKAAWEHAATLARARLARLGAAEDGDVAVNGDALARELDRLRETFGLNPRARLDQWRRDNGLSGHGLAALLEREALIAEGPEPPGFEQALLDVLRMTGGYERLSTEGRDLR